MTTYKNGSQSRDVVSIQTALRKAGFYFGRSDGVFGNGTEASVKAFQKANGLDDDGQVGPATWTKLFSVADAIPVVPVEESTTPPVAETPAPEEKEDSNKPEPEETPEPVVKTAEPEPEQDPTPTSSSNLAESCLALVGTIETSKLPPECFASVIGDFDGQGMSFGALQWNLGQGTLQPLLKKMLDNHLDIVTKIFGANTNLLRSVATGKASSAMAFARSIQLGRYSKLVSPWDDMFNTLGLTKEFQEIEVEAASHIFDRATDMCESYGLKSKRGRALMFDICVQNGSIRDSVKREIYRGHYTGIDEVSKMRLIANAIADNANPSYAEDVRARKLTIANGKGIIHQTKFDLAEQFGLDMADAD